MPPLTPFEVFKRHEAGIPTMGPGRPSMGRLAPRRRGGEFSLFDAIAQLVGETSPGAGPALAALLSIGTPRRVRYPGQGPGFETIPFTSKNPRGRELQGTLDLMFSASDPTRAEATIKADKDAPFTGIGARHAQEALGLKGLLELGRFVKKQHPELKTLEAMRIGGLVGRMEGTANREFDLDALAAGRPLREVVRKPGAESRVSPAEIELARRSMAELYGSTMSRRPPVRRGR